MLLLDLTSTKEQAFANGFMKGVAAPLILFSNFAAPKLQGVSYVEPQTSTVNQAISSDWAMVGNDISVAAGKYGKAAARAK